MLRDVNEQRGFLLWGWFGRLRFLSCSGQQQSGYSGKIKNNTEDHEMLVTTTRCKMHLSRASSRDDLCWPRKKKGWCSATDVTLTKCADFCALEKVCPLYEGRTKIDHHIMNERSFVEKMGRGMAMTSESIAWKGKLTLLVEANGMRPRGNLQKVLRWVSKCLLGFDHSVFLLMFSHQFRVDQRRGAIVLLWKEMCAWFCTRAGSLSCRVWTLLEQNTYVFQWSITNQDIFF